MKPTLCFVTLCLTALSSVSCAARKPIVVGGGATFPAPLYQLAIADFEDQYPNLKGKLIYNMTPRYREQKSIGSLKGSRLLGGNDLAFAGTDWPLTKEQIAKIKGPVVQIPTLVGAVAIVYNLPGLSDSDTPNPPRARKALNFSSKVLAQIFQGHITRWDDPYIQRLNPGVILPSEKIIAVHRSDGSGTTHILANFLTQNAPDDWTVGNDFKIKKWAKNSIGAGGSEELAETVAGTSNSIGYVEFEYAERSHLVHAKIQVMWNGKTEFVSPSIDSIRAAARNESQVLPKDTTGSTKDETPEEKAQREFANIQNPFASGNAPYPISGFTWLVLKPLDAAPQYVLCKFLEFLPKWSERYAETYGYTDLRPEVVGPEVVAENARKTSEVCH